MKILTLWSHFRDFALNTLLFGYQEMGFLVCIVYVTSVDWGVYFSVNSLLALVGVCHTSVNPGRCKEEAWVQGHAATGSVKTHFSNTQVYSCFASNSILQPAKKRLTTHMRLENCAKKGVSGRMGEALGLGTLCMEVHLGGNTILL